CWPRSDLVPDPRLAALRPRGLRRHAADGAWPAARGAPLRPDPSCPLPHTSSARVRAAGLPPARRGRDGRRRPGAAGRRDGRYAGVTIRTRLRFGGVVVVTVADAAGAPGLAAPGGPLDGVVELVASGLAQGQAGAGAAVDLTLLWRTRVAPGSHELVLRLYEP